MILITGSNGQLGTELRKLMDSKEISYYATDVGEMDITNFQNVQDTVKKIQPDVIFHCAAYTAVDKAEDEGKELDEAINVEGTRNVALAAKEVNAMLVYVSTDYVFDGTKIGSTYLPDDTTNPESEYGRTKLLGEKIVQEILDDYYIVRTSWVFGNYGHNFVYTMLRLAENHSEIKVVDDQTGRPTWTKSLAEFIVFLEKNRPANGVYHFSNEGQCTWYEFAKEILKHSDVTVLPVSSSEYPQKAKRPEYSVLDLKKTEDLGFQIMDWKVALREMMDGIETVEQ